MLVPAEDDHADTGAVTLPEARRQLSPEEQERVDKAMKAIEDIWSDKNKGTYKIEDEDAWKRMPMFMSEITEEDVATNPMCAALSSIVYDDADPEETAENRKAAGNKSVQLAMDPERLRAILKEHPEQIKTSNIENILRSAVGSYTEGIQARCANRNLNAQLFANRSLAHFLMQNYGHGLEDSQRAIILDPEYTKAYYRGAKCAEKVRRYEIARSLVEKGLRTNPSDAARAEFAALVEVVADGERAVAEKQKRDRLKVRADAADSNALVRQMQNRGIRFSGRLEISTDQFAQLGHKKPYFDESDVLHVPILFMYDEYSTTDFLQDVPTDATLADILTEEGIMPFPWDDRGRYSTFDDIVAVFKIDDGVKMPQYHAVSWTWSLLEVLRRKDYEMPAMLPTFHIVPKASDLVKEWGLTFPSA